MHTYVLMCIHVQILAALDENDSAKKMIGIANGYVVGECLF